MKTSDREQIAEIDDEISRCRRQLDDLHARREGILLRARNEKVHSKYERRNIAYYLRYQDTTIEKTGVFYPSRSVRQVAEAMGVSRDIAMDGIRMTECDLNIKGVSCPYSDPYLDVLVEWLKAVEAS